MPRALVVDDNRQMADSLCQMLEFFGIETEPAYGPRAAMLRLAKIIPDILFMDIHMSGVDGFEVLAYLRRMPQMENLPVVFVTSDDQPETEKKVRKTGALHLIVKPPTLSALEGVLQQAGLIE